MYSNTLLDQCRQQADDNADAVVAQIFAQNKPKLIAEIQTQWQVNQDLFAPTHKVLPDFVQTFAQDIAQMPKWANKALLAKGQALFALHTEPILSMLGFLSLPYCYAAASGVQVLYLTQKIGQNTINRLKDTARFVLDACQPDAFEPQGKAWASIAKVRLMHALVRFQLKRSPKWQSEWGIPINQEDMAGTNLAFSLIAIRGLRKIGIQVSPDEAEAYQHLWNVIGFALGVQEELLPEDSKSAFWLDKRISQRHFKPSEAGRELTKRLLNAFDQNPESPFPKGFPISFMRFLLGKDLAQILDLPPTNWTASLLPYIVQNNYWQNYFPFLPNQMRNGNIIKQLNQREEVEK